MLRDYFLNLIDELMMRGLDILELLDLEQCYEKQLTYMCMLEELDEMINCIERILVIHYQEF